MSDFFSRLDEYAKKGWIPDKFQKILEDFYTNYKRELEDHGLEIEKQVPLFITYLDLIRKQIESPYLFEPYHEQICAPFDYYTFGIDFLRPLVDMNHSSIVGLEQLDQIKEQLKKGDNVIFFANHQIEADPQAISILLEKTHPEIGKQMIFVAGDRVVTDPVAVPFSLGRNLLCIYSKRYIDHPPEQKMQKQLHNKRTMELMSELLSMGGKIIYVAPSGGRDRLNGEGIVEVAKFDPQSIEMFYLMAKRADRPTHFYPLALATYDLLPPPETIQVELGETRRTKRGGIHLSCGAEIQMEKFSNTEYKDKHDRREARADFIWRQVNEAYRQFI